MRFTEDLPINLFLQGGNEYRKLKFEQSVIYNIRNLVTTGKISIFYIYRLP